MTASRHNLGPLEWVYWGTIIVLLYRCTADTESADESLLPYEYSDTWTNEDVRFAEARCQADSSGTDGALIALWANRTYPDNHETHCYVKCFLGKIGLIDLVTRGLDAQKLDRFLGNIDEDLDKNCLINVDLEELLSGTCQSYYTKWMTFRSNCEELVDLVMFSKTNITFIHPPQSKSLGQTAVEFCEVVEEGVENGGEEKGGEDSIPSYYMSFLTQYNCNLSCIFKHFRYFDGYGRLDGAEIVRSFREAGLLTSPNTAAVDRCTHRANSYLNIGFCAMAKELYTCLWKSTKDFAKVYEFRDMLTRKY